MSGQDFDDKAARLFGNKCGPASYSHSEVGDDHEGSVDVGSRIDEQEGDFGQMKRHSQSQDWDYDELEQSSASSSDGEDLILLGGAEDEDQLDQDAPKMNTTLLTILH